jgi:hypothetical protein
VLGEDFLLTCQQLSVGYRELRTLRQLTTDGTVTIDGTAVKLFEDIEVTNLLDVNNPFYNVTAKMQLMQSTTITNNIGITTSSRPVIGVAAKKVLGV